MLTLMLSAWAGDSVLNLSSVDDPEAQVAALATVAPETLTVITLAALQQRPARLEGGGELTWCAAAPTDLASLQALVQDAEKSIAYMEYDAAASTLGEAITGMACLTEPVDPEWAARTHYLNGITAHRSGFSDAASESFQQAVAFDPDIAWDDAFAPKAKALFDVARTKALEAEKVSVMVAPRHTVVVDGQSVTGDLQLVPGKHLVQAGQTTATLEIFPGTSPTLVLPAGLHTPEVFDDGARANLALVLADDSLYVVDPDSIWRWDGSEWAVLGETNTSRRPEEPIGSIEAPRTEPVLHPVTWPGMALLGIGAATATASRIGVKNSYEQASTATDWETYSSHAIDYENYVWATQLGLGVTAAGAVLTGTGLVLTVTR